MPRLALAIRGPVKMLKCNLIEIKIVVVVNDFIALVGFIAFVRLNEKSERVQIVN